MKDLLLNLPGEDFIREGIIDIGNGRMSVPACLTALASRGLKRAGLLPPVPPDFFDQDIERVLYRLLREEKGDAYSKYNAWLRRLSSFEHALARRLMELKAKSDQAK